MQLFSVSRRKKPGYVHGAAHKVYDNRLKQNFHAKKRNRKWCTDFTYLTLADGRKRYNCTIIDLYDRSVVASITDRNITSDLAIRTLEKDFNTLKSELIYQHNYRTETELYSAIEEFAYVHYNHVRPHSYNNYKTPFETRCGRYKPDTKI